MSAAGLISVAAFEFVSRVDTSNALYGKAAIQLARVWLLGFLAHRHQGQLWLWALLLYLCELSYALYQTHSPMLFIIRHLWPGRRIGSDTLLCLLTAALLYHGVDAPIRRRLRTGRRPAPTAAPAGPFSAVAEPPQG